VREVIQKEATNSIIKNDYQGILLVAPRVGKSKIIIDSLLLSSFKSILIVAPLNSILDSWEVEIEKWGREIRERVMLVNQRSIKDKHKADIIICDECHTLSKAQITKIRAMKFDRVLGSTGTISDANYKELRPICKKIIYNYSIANAIKDEIISNYNITVITCQLDSKDKYVPAGTVKKPFKTTEQGAYDYFTKEFNKFRVLAFKDKKYENIKYMYAGKRSRLIYGAKSKINITKRLIQKIKGKKLIFTILNDVADELAKYSYHSGIKSKVRDYNLELFRDGKINDLSVCNMLSMGFTDKRLKTGIFHQLQSSEEPAQQKIMRMCNYVEGETADVYILAYEGTVDIDWLNKALQPFNSKKITYDSWRNYI